MKPENTAGVRILPPPRGNLKFPARTGRLPPGLRPRTVVSTPALDKTKSLFSSEAKSFSFDFTDPAERLRQSEVEKKKKADERRAAILLAEKNAQELLGGSKKKKPQKNQNSKKKGNPPKAAPKPAPAPQPEKKAPEPKPQPIPTTSLPRNAIKPETGSKWIDPNKKKRKKKKKGANAAWSTEVPAPVTESKPKSEPRVEKREQETVAVKSVPSVTKEDKKPSEPVPKDVVTTKEKATLREPAIDTELLKKQIKDEMDAQYKGQVRELEKKLEESLKLKEDQLDRRKESTASSVPAEVVTISTPSPSGIEQLRAENERLRKETEELKEKILEIEKKRNQEQRELIESFTGMLRAEKDRAQKEREESSSTISKLVAELCTERELLRKLVNEK